jgi:RNA polymerase sigma-70 factor (ECF subfamily)
MRQSIDEKAFLQAYTELADAIFRHCYYRLYDREKAKDVVQDTFMKVWKYIGTGKQVKNLKALIYQTARNLIIDEARKKKTRVHISIEEMFINGIDPTATDQEISEARLDALRAMNILKKIDSADRELVLMRYAQGYEPREIAKLLGLSANVVSVRLHRALQKMRELIIKDYGEQF